MWTYANKIVTTSVVGLAAGVALGHVIGLNIRSDNVPFFMAFGAVIGLCTGLAVGLASERK